MDKYYGSLDKLLGEKSELPENMECVECRGKIILPGNESYFVCESCGLEYGMNYEANEETGQARVFNADQAKNRAINRPDYVGYGPRTTVGNYFDDFNASSKMQNVIKRIRKAQKYGATNMERNYGQASFTLNNLAYKLGIAEYVKKTAWKIYQRVYLNSLLKGRSINSFVTSSLYAAIRIHEVPKILDELLNETIEKEKTINDNIRVIVRKVLPELGLKYKPVSPIFFIPKFSQELGLGIKFYTKACDNYKEAKKKGLNDSGKDPKGVAAAAIYVTSKRMKLEITQIEIAKVCGITEVTLRNGMKQIKKYLK